MDKNRDKLIEYIKNASELDNLIISTFITGMKTKQELQKALQQEEKKHTLAEER